MGVADGRKLPIRWSKTENIRWSVKLPGWGTSSPIRATFAQQLDIFRDEHTWIMTSLYMIPSVRSPVSRPRSRC
jgi:hypothetical protein